jgi:3-hydroxypropanoate dehydrogenase
VSEAKPGALDPVGLDLLFREARTHQRFTDQPVTDDELRDLYALLKLGPTSANSSPAKNWPTWVPASAVRAAPAALHR